MKLSRAEMEAIIRATLSGVLEVLQEKDAPQLLSTAEAAQSHIASKKPHLKRPTWTYQSQAVTCVWPLLDVIGGPKRQEMKLKAVAYIREHGLGWMTVGHKVIRTGPPRHLKSPPAHLKASGITAYSPRFCIHL